MNLIKYLIYLGVEMSGGGLNHLFTYMDIPRIGTITLAYKRLISRNDKTKKIV